MNMKTIYTEKNIDGWFHAIHVEPLKNDHTLARQVDTRRIWILMAATPDREHWESSDGEKATNKLPL
jgi:hypothetical protein